MNTSIHLEPFLLNEVLADDLPVGERKIRLIVRAFSHVMTMCLRNGQAFALPDVVHGPVAVSYTHLTLPTNREG